jgi:hypothetical protein
VLRLTFPVAALALASTAAGVQPATLKLGLRYPIACGRPSGALTISLPSRLTVPSRIPPASVRMNGLAAGRVAVDGNDVTVSAARASGVMCHVVIEGRLTVVFTSAAAIGSPTGSDTYDVTVRYGTHTVRTTLTVTA